MLVWNDISTPFGFLMCQIMLADHFPKSKYICKQIEFFSTYLVFIHSCSENYVFHSSDVDKNRHKSYTSVNSLQNLKFPSKQIISLHTEPNLRLILLSPTQN